MLKTVVKKGSYHDSVVLMLLTESDFYDRRRQESIYHDGDTCQ